MRNLDNCPAKIQPPCFTEVYPRKRLFQQFDAIRQRTLVWISGMAGTGEPSLAASYVAERDLICLWYRVDLEDDDLDSFLH